MQSIINMRRARNKHSLNVRELRARVRKVLSTRKCKQSSTEHTVSDARHRLNNDAVYIFVYRDESINQLSGPDWFTHIVL